MNSGQAQGATGMELPEITKQIAEAWNTRKKADGMLSELLYRAWKIFEGRRGAPKKNESGVPAETFSSYLKERGIPRSTAKDLIRRHREMIREIEPPPPEPEGWDEELDGPGQFPATKVKDEIPDVVKAAGAVDYKAPTAAERTKLKNSLITELRKYEKEEVVTAIIDDAIIAVLQQKLGGYRAKRIDSATRKAIQKQYASDSALKPEWEEV